MVRYPLGQQDFKAIRTEGCLYVDKTRFIARLLDEGKYFFLARPRRFGKSLFLSTLEYFFRGEKTLFKGLEIESYNWDWTSYPVVHLDLNGANYTTGEESLALKLLEQIEGYEKLYDITPSSTDPSLRFGNLITGLYNKTGRQVVVLVDEYEKPVIDTSGNKDLSEHHRESLRAFYSVLKSLDKYLKLVFLTGISKFGQMSIFSALNNLRDITLSDNYASICGITQAELTTNFKEGIQGFANEEKVSFEEAVGILKENYDGYHFSRYGEDIYNPFSLINCMIERAVGPYWSATGSPKLLTRLMFESDFNMESLHGVSASAAQLTDIGPDMDRLIPLLYLTGYLTIKGYNPSARIYRLGFPNKEVESAFSLSLMPLYQKSKSKQPETYITDFAAGINDGQPVKAMEALQAFMASINYELVPEPEVERHFQLMVYMFTRMLLPYTTLIKTEDRTSDGRIDMVITTADYVYIIEMKRDCSAQTALNQIRNKDYAMQYKTGNRQTFLIGINFSSYSRCLEDFAISEES